MACDRGKVYITEIIKGHHTEMPLTNQEKSGNLKNVTMWPIYCKRRNFRAVHIFAHLAQGFRCAKISVDVLKE